MSDSFINYDFIFFALALFFSLAFVDCRLLRQQYGCKDAWAYLSWFSAAFAANFWLKLINQFYFIGENLLHINSFACYFAWVFLLLCALGVKDCKGEFSPVKGWWLFFPIAGAAGILRSSEAFAISRSCFIGVPAIVMLIRSYRLGNLFETRQNCTCQKLAITSTVAFSVSFIFVETGMIAFGQPIMALCALFSMMFAFALRDCSRTNNVEDASEFFLKGHQYFKVFLPVSLVLILPVGFVVTSYFTSRAMSNEFTAGKSQAKAFELILERYFEENRSMVKAMCQSGELINALQNSTDQAIEDADRLLDIFSASLPGSVAYFADKNGVVIASSNRNSEASFVGEDISFRPYFKDAMAGKNGSLLAKGTVSAAYGYYSSAPIFGRDGKLLGAGVIKISLDQLQTHFPAQPPIVLLDADGAIVVSNQKESYWEKLLPIDVSDFSTLSSVEDSGLKASLSLMFKLADQRIREVLNESNLIVWVYKLADSGWSVIQIEKPDSIVYARLLGLALTLLASLLFIGASTIRRIAIGTISIGQDIAEYRLIESTLRESKSKFVMLNNCFSRFGNSPEENISMLTEIARLISGADIAVSREVFEGQLRTLGISSSTEEIPDDLKSHCPYSLCEKFGKFPVLVKDLKQEEDFCCSLGRYTSAIITAAQIDDEQVGILACAYDNPVEEVSEENLNLLSIIVRSIEVEIARMREGRDLVKLIRELASRDKRMSLEMEIARTVHRSFLPSATPDFPPYEIGFVFKPCFSVGGDYFEFFPFQNHNQLGILFADISGHGVAGALLASMLKVILLAVGQKSNEPAKILMEMNDRIEENFPSGYFVSAFFTLLDTEKDVVKVACAAPEPVLLIRQSGEVELMGSGGRPLGLLPSEFIDNESFDSVELKLSEGDKILFFTDGLTDVKIADDERIGLVRLCEWCEEFSSLSSVELTRRLYERAEEMAVEGGIDDDIMILAIAKKSPLDQST